MKKFPVFGVRTDLLKAMMADPEWRAKWEKAESHEERRQVVLAFLKSKGYKIKDLEIALHERKQKKPC